MPSEGKKEERERGKERMEWGGRGREKERQNGERGRRDKGREKERGEREIHVDTVREYYE